MFVTKVTGRRVFVNEATTREVCITKSVERDVFVTRAIGDIAKKKLKSYHVVVCKTDVSRYCENFSKPN